jgi:hypothetical protein
MLTDRLIRSLRPAERGEVLDAVVPGLALRVSPTGSKSFVLIQRFPGSRNPTRRSLGKYGAITLQDARIKARRWLELIERGRDPAVELERERLAEVRKRASTVAAVAEDFVVQKLSRERQRKDAERTLRRLIKAWGDRPITDIAPLDVIQAIKPIMVSAPYSAHATLTLAKRFFAWAVDLQIYGIESSPCDRLRPSKIIGQRKPRQRVLSEDEIFALHRAASRMPYPHGPLLLMLLYSGQRHSDVALCPWNEISLGRGQWIIAAGRFKSEVSHLVPLSAPMMTLLSGLPRFKGSDKLFTHYGRSLQRGIVAGIKDDLDARMLRTLRALARKRGQDPNTVKLEPFVIHDIRRSLRTRLTELKVPTEVAEAVIGHGPRGIERHYNFYQYADEKADALERWAVWLRSIPPTNVVALRA